MSLPAADECCFVRPLFLASAPRRLTGTIPASGIPGRLLKPISRPIRASQQTHLKPTVSMRLSTQNVLANCNPYLPRPLIVVACQSPSRSGHKGCYDICESRYQQRTSNGRDPISFESGTLPFWDDSDTPGITRELLPPSIWNFGNLLGQTTFLPSSSMLDL